ncbi:MAG: hypothetical protein M3O55_00490 [Actinomycetota bacterium]|nr:hypothetical protein [Actinomycetota bacterium]
MKRPALTTDFLVAGLVRLLVVGFGLVAILVPLPGFSTPAAVLAVFALPLPFVAARWPDSSWVTGLVFVAIAEWIITSLFEGTPPVALSVLFGAMLYLLHATTAFAAALPLTRRVEPALLTRTLLRLLGVIAVSILLMLAVLALPGRPGSFLLALAGAAGAIGLAVVMVVLLHRRPAG